MPGLRGTAAALDATIVRMSRHGGRPILPLRELQVQKSRKPLRDQATTVSGLTMMSGFLQPGHSLDRQAQKKRSSGLR